MLLQKPLYHRDIEFLLYPPHDIKMSVTHDINSPWFNIRVGKKLGFWRAAVIALRLPKRHLIVEEWPYGLVDGRNSLTSMTVGILHRIYVTKTDANREIVARLTL